MKAIAKGGDYRVVDILQHWHSLIAEYELAQ